MAARESTMAGGLSDARDSGVTSALPWRWLVRHPRPEVAKGLCYGRLDVPAQPEDTERAAQTLARRLPEGLVLRSSPRQRCLTLAQRLHALRPDLVLLPPEAWLAEMDMGDWEGRPWAELPEAELPVARGSRWALSWLASRPGCAPSGRSPMPRSGSRTRG